MIKLTELEKHIIMTQANPTHHSLSDILVPDFAGDTKHALAQYVIDTYDLGHFDGVKNTSAPYMLDFTCRSENQQLIRITGRITYQA